MKLPFKKLALILSVCGLSALASGAAACAKTTVVEEPDNIEISKLAPPDDGSLPTAHTCAENLAYINYVFDHQPQYHSYSFGETKASIAEQVTRTFRDYKDGVLITTDLTYSSMVKGGTQTCTVFNENGEGEVYFRDSETPKENTVPTTAVWSLEAPVFFTERAYHYTYGLLPTELFNYIVNEQNITSSTEVKINADGTYAQTFTLDPVASTYFYQFGMKTRGGLGDYPVFNSIKCTVVFDGGWRILSCSVLENSTINKGFSMESKSNFTCNYWYGDDNFDYEHFGYYDSYYKKYLGSQELEQGGNVDEKLVIDVANVLSNGFSKVLGGGQQFEITAKLGANTYAGYAYASVPDVSDLGSLHIKLSLGRTLGEQGLFVEYGPDGLQAYYGENFALTANMAEVSLAANGFGEIIENIKNIFAKPQTVAEPPEGTAAEEAAGEDTADDEEESDPLSELMSSMQLVAGEKQAVLTLDTDDLLGLGVGINVRFVFAIYKNTISIRGGSVGGLSVGGHPLDININIRTTSAPEISHESVDAPARLEDYVADVYSLLDSDLIRLGLSLHGDGEKVSVSALKDLNVDVTADVDKYGVAAAATAEISYAYQGNRISAGVQVDYKINGTTGAYGEAAVALKHINGKQTDLVVFCDIEQVADAVASLVTVSGGGLDLQTDGLVSMLSAALTHNFSYLLTELSADSGEIRVGLSIDALLKTLEIDTGIKFGNCALSYKRGSDVYGGRLAASLPALGLSISLQGAEGQLVAIDTADALDLAYVVADVADIVNADYLKLNLSLDGGASGVTLSQLNGLTAELNAYVNMKGEGALVGAEAEIAHAYGEGASASSVSAGLAVWYVAADKDVEGNMGRAVVSLTHVNGRPVAANVTCDIKEIVDGVQALLKRVDVENEPFELGISSVSDVVANLLTADLDALLPGLFTTKNTLGIELDVEYLLELLNVDLGSFKPGKLSLLYDKNAEYCLVAGLPALGIDIGLGASESGAAAMPEIENCLDLADLLSVVNAAWDNVDKIIADKSLAFFVERGKSYLSLDGLLVEICGNGEISWADKGAHVALDLVFAITNSGAGGNGRPDEMTFRLLYDKDAVDAPLVRIALNDVGLDIYESDIDNTVNSFNDIFARVKTLFGLETPDVKDEVNLGASAAVDAISGNDKLLAVVFKILARTDWVGLLNNLTATTDGRSLALAYLDAACIEARANDDGSLLLDYNANVGERFSLAGNVVVGAHDASIVANLNCAFAAANMASSKNSSASFVHLVYNFLFDAIHGISVENILGSDTYAITFVLDGDNCNVAALDGVFIDAEIYVTGERGEQGKLAEANLNVNAAGVVIELNVITEQESDGTHFYINLNRVMDVQLPDLKFKATQNSLYKTLDALFMAITHTDVLDVVAALLPKSGETEPAAKPSNDAKVPVETVDKLADIIDKLLNVNFSEAFVATDINGQYENDGVLDATLDLNDFLGQLGITNEGDLGSVRFEINHNTHSMKTSAVAEVINSDGVKEKREWISLSSALTNRRTYNNKFKDDYISIEFLPDLINDLIATVTDDEGKLYDKFTFSGTVTATVGVGRLNFDLNIDICTLTVGINSETGLYVSAVLHIQKVSALGIVKIPECTVGLTIKNGLVTLAKGLDSTAPEYKVLTLEFLLDHMLTKEKDSVLCWWLDVSGWDTVISILNLAGIKIDSGLTTPEELYLYDSKTEGEQQEISMYDFVKALRVVVNGKRTADFGDISSLESEFGLIDNYYGFILDADKATGGVLTKLYAAITRNENGISGIKASGAIQSYVTFSLSLAYNEGCSEEFVPGSTFDGTKAAPCFYDKALAIAEQNGFTVDFDHFVKMPEKGYDEAFGCFSTTGLKVEYSHVLYSHVLTVIKADGSIETRDVRHGSTVYLYDNYSPLFTDSNKNVRVLYSTVEDEVGAASTLIEKDLTVYAVKRKAATIYVRNGSEERSVSSFEGDLIPTKVKGLETIGTPTYEDGTPVKDGDVVGTGVTSVKIYGVFVVSEPEINGVKYAFSPDTMSYIAAGKAAGFNDAYSVKGKTLVLENEIGGYPVTAIAEKAFANLDGHPIKSVVVPSNIVTVGENAFLDNIDMQSAVFLADNVQFLGKDGSSKTMPFYGCSLSTNEEKTQLKVYYKSITANGKWNHFRYVNKVISFNFYIGDNGGNAYSGNSWQYAVAEVEVNTNGATYGMLSKESVEETLSAYYPVCVEGSFVGSTAAAKAEEALVNSFNYYEFSKDGVDYTCKYTVDYSVRADGVVVANFVVSYSVARHVTISATHDCVYGGVTVRAGETLVLLQADGEDLLTPAPVLPKYKFSGWTQNGDVYTANFVEKTKYKLTVEISYKAGATTVLHVGNKTATATVVSGASIDVEVYEGEVQFTMNGVHLTVSDGTNEYDVYAKEASVTGKEKNNFRNISSDFVGVKVVDGNFKITLTY